MLGRMPDPSLNELVDELVRFGPTDQAAILEALDSNARMRIEAMLAQDVNTAPGSVALDLSVLSPWLADLVLAGRTMKVDAHMVLKESAGQLFEKPMGHAASHRPSLLGRIGARFSGQKTA